MKDTEKQIEICGNCKKQNNCNHRELIHKDSCKVNDCDCFQNISIDTVKQIEEMEMAREIHRALLNCKNESCSNCEFNNDSPMSFCKAEYIAKAISEKYQPKLPKDSVVLSKEEYEKLKKYEYKVQCGVCFTQKEWFDFINEDSNFRTSLLIKAEEKGYEQAHKEMLKDCIESNKIAEQIGYEKGSKETAEKILKKVKTTAIPTGVGKYSGIKFLETSEEELNEIAKQFGVEIKE